MKKTYMVVSMVLIVTILAAIAVSGTMVSKTGKENDRLNPAPFDKIKSPISSSGLSMLYNKEQFTPEIMGNVKKEIGSPTLANIKFNLETGNLHQNEETVGAYRQYVLSGANDYRGFFGILGGVSGYYVSKDNGTSTWREGALPTLSGVESGTAQAFTAYSGGDPVIDVYKATGDFYYGSLYFDDTTNTWALGLAKSTPAKLVDKTLTDAQVWQVTNVRADDAGVQANDKEWVAVDNTAGTYKGKIYVTWTAFNAAGAKIWMARCNPSPLSCSTTHNNANAVSGAQTETQMSKVSIDSAGRVIVTWVEYISTGVTTPPYYKVKLWYRVYAPGGVVALTAPRLIATLDKPVSGYYALQGNEMRVPAGLWNEVTTVAGKSRMYTAYFKCNGAYLYDDMVGYADSCSNSDSYLKYVDGYETATPTMSSEMGLETSPIAHSFWPTMSINPASGTLDIAWYQTEAIMKHDYSVAYQQRSLSTPTTITSPTSLIYAGDPDSEVYFGTFGTKYGYINGIFIGDYFHITTQPGTPNRIYIGYNGNTRYAAPITYTHPTLGTFKMGGNQMDNILYTKTY